MHAKAILKATGFLSLLGLGQVALEPSNLETLKILLELVIMVAGMISIAVVMRTDVKGLKDWREEHKKLHEKHEEAHTELTQQIQELAKTSESLLQLSRFAESRLTRLEQHEDNQ